MLPIPPLLYKDFYKVDHRPQYPNGLTYLYSNNTPRMSRIPGIDKVINFGLQYPIKEYLIRQMNENFFKRDKSDAVHSYKRVIDLTLLGNKISFDHIGELHDLGYLPLKIKTIPEGSLVNIKIPVFTIQSTHKKFGWLVNMWETLLSCCTWPSITSATTAFEYRKLMTRYALATGGSLDFVKFQAHDFSMRGMMGPEAASMSGAAHLTSFLGTDTIPAILFHENYYGAQLHKMLVGTSVYATEHSVMCMGGREGEFDIYKRLLTEVYPDEEYVSIVSDTYDLWNVLTNYMPRLKDVIMGRRGKTIIRPDSGDPVDIICGDPNADPNSPEGKGVVELLWDVFGGKVNNEGFKQLDPHIGAIYGDSITLQRAEQILHRLMQKGFASDCIVLGVGSFTYTFTTRDTFGLAMKATFATINDEPTEVFKDPKTDGGKAAKKSAKGLLKVTYDPATKDYTLHESVTPFEENEGELVTVFENGKMVREFSLAEIRARIDSHLV